MYNHTYDIYIVLTTHNIDVVLAICGYAVAIISELVKL